MNKNRIEGVDEQAERAKHREALVINALEARGYLLGWKAYFGLAQTPGIWRGLDPWLRHRLRAIQLRHWKRPGTIHRELKALGASQDVARQVAGNCHW